MFEAIECCAAAVCFNRRKNSLDLALKQSGGLASKASAERSLSFNVRDNASGVIRVLLRELDTTSEHAVFLGAEVQCDNINALKLVECTHRLATPVADFHLLETFMHFPDTQLMCQSWPTQSAWCFHRLTTQLALATTLKPLFSLQFSNDSMACRTQLLRCMHT